MAPARPGHEDGTKLVPQLQNNYQRPNYPWVCGNAAVGDPCWTGPTPAGKCGCRSECRPISRQGSWACSRPVHRGGPCAEGPSADGTCCRQRTPCVPRRSWLAQRSRLSFALFCVCLGVALMIYGSGQTYEAITPGPLSSPHAQHLAHHGNDRCAACHPAAHQSLGQWLGGLAGLPSASAYSSVSQTDLCLKCHQRDLCSDHALFAHNVDPQTLAQHPRRVANDSDSTVNALMKTLSSRLVSSPVTKLGQPLACATCHQEHHGQQIDMKAMTDQQCQTCHSQTFHSFELDHPEFTLWPEVPAQGIRFDHRTHHFKHFPQANRTFECSQCHQDDAQGNVQKLVPFEQACGSCHQGQIDLSSQGGLAWLQLPSFDLEAFEAVPERIGQWPPILAADFDGRLAPISELLLMADKPAATALEFLGHDFDFLDLDTQNPQQLKAAAHIAWGVKRLLADLADRGREAVRQRLQIVLDQPIDDTQLTRLTQNFSATLFQDTARQWFPDLAQEVSRDDYAPMSRFVPTVAASVATKPPAHSAAKSPSNEPLVIPHDILARLLVRTDQFAQDSPQELLIENPLANYRSGATIGPKTGTETNPQTRPQTGPQTNPQTGSPTSPATGPQTVAQTDPPNRTTPPAGGVSGDPPRGVEAITRPAAEPGPTAATPRSFVRPQHVDEPDLLARNPLADYGPIAGGTPQRSTDNFAGPDHSVAGQGGVQPTLSTPPGQAFDGTERNIAAAPTTPQADLSPATPVAPEKPGDIPPPTDLQTTQGPTNLLPNGPSNGALDGTRASAAAARPVGWVRDDARFAIQYHLAGHADPWLQAWIDLAVEQRRAAVETLPVMEFLVGAIAAPERAGNCLQCHGGREPQSVTASVQWTGRYRDPSIKDWTKFNHRPHTLLPSLSDCRSCHQLRETDGPSESSGAGQGNLILAGFSRSVGTVTDSGEGSPRGSAEPTVTPDSLSATRRSDFHALTKSQCAACHQQNGTRSSCTTCHNYHIGQQVPH